MRLDILAIDATHPDERPAGEAHDALFQLLARNPVQGVRPEIGNTEAYLMGPDEAGRHRRFVARNQARAEPDPEGDVEEQRMYGLDHMFAMHHLVFDRHGNHTQGHDWAFCHPKAKQQVWDALATLGISRVVHYLAPHWSAMYRNYLGVDLSPTSPLTAKNLRLKLAEIAVGQEPKGYFPIAHHYGLKSIMMDEAAEHGLPLGIRSDPFTPLPPEAIERLGYPQNALTLGIDVQKYGHTGCWSEVVQPID